MRVFLLAMILSLALSNAYADFSNPLDTVSQVATNVSNVGTVTIDASPSNTSSTNASTVKATTPIAIHTLARMDCAALEVAQQNTTRELERIKVNIEKMNRLDSNAQSKQQNSDTKPVGALGGLLANQTNESSSAAQPIANPGNTSQDQDMQQALGKKYSRDLNNITIYQKHKKCLPLKD